MVLCRRVFASTERGRYIPGLNSQLEDGTLEGELRQSPAAGNDRCRLQLLSIDQLRELLEKITGIVWARRGFGVILYTENRELLVSHSFDRAVIQIDMRDLNLFW